MPMPCLYSCFLHHTLNGGANTVSDKCVPCLWEASLGKNRLPSTICLQQIVLSLEGGVDLLLQLQIGNSAPEPRKQWQKTAPRVLLEIEERYRQSQSNKRGSALMRVAQGSSRGTVPQESCLLGTHPLLPGRQEPCSEGVGTQRMKTKELVQSPPAPSTSNKQIRGRPFPLATLELWCSRTQP